MTFVEVGRARLGAGRVLVGFELEGERRAFDAGAPRVLDAGAPRVFDAGAPRRFVERDPEAARTDCLAAGFLATPLPETFGGRFGGADFFAFMASGRQVNQDTVV